MLFSLSAKNSAVGATRFNEVIAADRGIDEDDFVAVVEYKEFEYCDYIQTYEKKYFVDLFIHQKKNHQQP